MGHGVGHVTGAALAQVIDELLDSGAGIKVDIKRLERTAAFSHGYRFRYIDIYIHTNIHTFDRIWRFIHQLVYVAAALARSLLVGMRAVKHLHPLGALYDAERRVEVVIDQELVDAGRVTVHPCDNTATVLLATEDLVALLRERGCTVRVVELRHVDNS